jgi:hypothetical protein
MTSPPSPDSPLDALVVDETIIDQPAQRGGWREMIDNPWLVLATLFFVTAALGLPVLWISRAFSRTSKIILSVVVAFYTVLLLYVFWIVMVWCYTRIVDSL